MLGFSWNLALAVIWMLLTGEFSGRAFVIGFGLGALCLWALEHRIPAFEGYTVQWRELLGFVGYVAKTAVRSSISIAGDVITAGVGVEPGVIAVPLELESSFEMALMANAVTVPPATLTVDVSDDREVMYIHVVYLHDEEELLAQLKDVEQRILRLVR